MSAMGATALTSGDLAIHVIETAERVVFRT
jgi:hypothetical protein